MSFSEGNEENCKSLHFCMFFILFFFRVMTFCSQRVKFTMHFISLSVLYIHANILEE